MESYFFQPITNILLMFIINLALAKYNLSYAVVKCSCGLTCIQFFLWANKKSSEISLKEKRSCHKLTSLGFCILLDFAVS